MHSEALKLSKTFKNVIILLLKKNEHIVQSTNIMSVFSIRYYYSVDKKLNKSFFSPKYIAHTHHVAAAYELGHYNEYLLKSITYIEVYITKF